MTDDAKSRFIKLYDEIERNYKWLRAMIPEECLEKSIDALFDECQKFEDNDSTGQGFIHNRGDHEIIKAFLNCSHARTLIKTLSMLTDPIPMKDCAVQLAVAHSHSSYLALRAIRNNIDDQKKSAHVEGQKTSTENRNKNKITPRNKKIREDVESLWGNRKDFIGNLSGTATRLIEKNQHHGLSNVQLVRIIKKVNPDPQKK